METLLSDGLQPRGWAEWLADYPVSWQMRFCTPFFSSSGLYSAKHAAEDD